MPNEILKRAARVITDLRNLAKTLNDAGYPMSSIRLQGFASVVEQLEGELLQAQIDAKLAG
jgi:hypothetical protein